MKADKSSMAGGMLMLFGLVMMLSVPMAIGYVVLKPAPAVVQADASLAH